MPDVETLQGSTFVPSRKQTANITLCRTEILTFASFLLSKLFSCQADNYPKFVQCCMSAILVDLF